MTRQCRYRDRVDIIAVAGFDTTACCRGQMSRLGKTRWVALILAYSSAYSYRATSHSSHLIAAPLDEETRIHGYLPRTPNISDPHYRASPAPAPSTKPTASIRRQDETLQPTIQAHKRYFRNVPSACAAAEYEPT